jgi:hypothetical protein
MDPPLALKIIPRMEDLAEAPLIEDQSMVPVPLSISRKEPE